MSRGFHEEISPSVFQAFNTASDEMQKSSWYTVDAKMLLHILDTPALRLFRIVRLPRIVLLPCIIQVTLHRSFAQVFTLLHSLNFCYCRWWDPLFCFRYVVSHLGCGNHLQWTSACWNQHHGIHSHGFWFWWLDAVTTTLRLRKIGLTQHCVVLGTECIALWVKRALVTPLGWVCRIFCGTVLH